MGGKKTVEDSRRFEKDRRDKLNAAFEELCKLLPDHDPLVTLSKMEILKRAAQYIKQLQDQNDEIMKLGSDSVLRTESERLKKRVTHLLLKTKELVDALRSAGVPIPSNKKKRKKKVTQNIPSNQNQIAPDKQACVQTSKEDIQIVKKVKCGCMKASPEKKPLKESNPTATTLSSSVGNVPAICSDSTSGQSIISGTNLITVTPPVIGAPILATKIQNVPLVSSTTLTANLSSNPPIISNNIVPLNNSAIYEGITLNGNANALKSNHGSIMTSSRLPTTVISTPSLVKELVPPNLNNKAIPVVTAASSNIMTTQSFVNSTQIINLPPCNGINNPIVAPRIQNVPAIEKNILSNLGPGTLILSDGRIVNVPPIVPQIVVKPQPAVILMPTAKKKEKLLIPKRREVTKTTFANKAPIPAIQTFRLESFPRVRPKKKPSKPLKKVEKKSGGNIESEQINKKRKLDKVSQSETLESAESSENKLQEGSLPRESISNVHSEGTGDKGSCENVTVSSDNSSIEPLDSIDSHLNDCSSNPSQTSCSHGKLATSGVNSSLTSSPTLKEVSSSPLSSGEVLVTTTVGDPLSYSTSSTENVGPATSKQPEENLTLVSVASFNDVPLPSQKSDADSSSSIFGSFSSTLSVSNNENQREAPLTDGNISLDVALSQESVSNHVDTPTNACLSTSIDGHTKVQADNSLIYDNHSRPDPPCNEVLTNLPSCVSSSKEQDSVFDSNIDQQGKNESEITKCSLSGGSIVKQVCSDIENSVSLSNKAIAKSKTVDACPQENQELSSSPQSDNTYTEKNSSLNGFNKASPINQNIQTVEDHLTEISIRETERISDLTNGEFINTSVNSNDSSINEQNINSISDLAGGPDRSLNNNISDTAVHLSSGAVGRKERPHSPNTTKEVYSQPRTVLNQPTPCSNNVTTTSCPLTSATTVSTSQSVCSSSQEKDFTHLDNTSHERNLPKSSNLVTFPNYSSYYGVPHTQNSISADNNSNSQISLHNNPSYRISSVHPDKELLLFNSVYSKPAALATSEKNSSADSSLSNVLPVYSSSTYCTSGTVSHNQSTFNLKHNNNPVNMLPSSGARNVDVYSGFNQAFPTQIGDKPFYPQNVSFSHNSLSRPPHWDKSQCNKSPYINNFGGDACEDQNLKGNSTYQRNKNGLIEKQNEHTQSAYFSFQNEPVTSHSNTFFHGLSTCSTTIPLSCSFSDSSAVFPYHSNPTSVVSSYSFIPHENITSFNRSSTGDMKTIHQDRSYLSNIPNIESTKPSFFRNNDKVIDGTIAFYPSSSQGISTTYSNSVQSVTSSGHSSFSHTKTSSSYTSSQMSTSAYPTLSQYNASTYSNSVNHSTSSMYTSTHPISSSIYTNLSQSGSYSTPQLNTTNVFTRSSQPSSSNTYCIPTHQNVSNVKNTSSSSYLNSNQHHASSIYTNSTQSNMSSSTQPGTSSAYISSVQSMYSSPSQSAAPTVNSSSVQHNNYPKSTNLQGIYTSTPLHTSDSSSNVSRVYTGTTLPNISSIYTCTAPSITHAYTNPIQANATSVASRYNTCGRSVAESPLYQSDSSKPIQSSENSGCISLSNFNSDSTVVLNNTKTGELTNQPSSVPSKKSELVATDNQTFSDVSRSKENNKPSNPQTDSSLNDQRHIKPMETSYLQNKEVTKNKYPSSDLPLVNKRPSVSERNIFNINLTEKEHPGSQIAATTSKSSEPTEKERTADIDKYKNYNFVPSKGKDGQNKRVDIIAATTKSNETNEKSVQSSSVNNSTDKISESNSFVPNSNQKSVSTEVSQNNVTYNYSNQTSSSYQQIIQPQNNNFSSISAAVQTKPYSNCNSSGCEPLNQYSTKSVPNTLNAGGHSKEGESQPSHPLPPSGNTGNSAEQLSKGSLVDVRGPEKQDKSIQKSYETVPEGNHLKISSDVTADFLKAKDIERNTFIPIIDDVRLPTDFSTDLFSSLQVPAGGSHSESISPTAAFLLAFPLVSTSRNIESLHDNENHENHTSTPTTILQIGNIEPPSTELFHPIDFQKGSSKSADHFDINNDYLQVGDLHEKQNQTIYKRCEKRKDTFTDYGKDMRPTDPKQKSNQQPKSAVPTTNTYTQSYSQPLLSCNEYQYCEKDSSQWQQEFSSNTSKEQKKTCDRKKDKVVQKSCFNQNYQEYYNYKDKKRKQQNRISVNWMTTPENREPVDYPNKEPETVNNLICPPSQSLYSGMSLDFPGEPFPEFCNAKKPNNYSWSPSKSLLPTLDNHLMIPSTLPTLVGDLALGTSTPSETYKTYDMPKTQPQVQGHMAKKTPEKLDVNKKQSEFSKSQANFFSVSQLVDHKSKKQKTGERNYKRLDKNSKSRNNLNCPKRKDDHCMYYEDRNNFITNPNQYSDKRHTYKGGSYSAESLIGVQHNEIDFSSSFNYQQNTNYFQGEFPPTVESSSQQYGYFQQTPFSGFNHDECQEFGFNSNQRVLDNSRQKNSLRKDDNYQVTASLLQPQLCPPYTKSMNYNLPSSHINTNTTSTLTNFNLSTIFPEMNDQRVGTSVQAPQQMNSSYPNSQNYRSHLS